MRTLPKAPRPTTRSRRKWLRLAIYNFLGQRTRSREWKWRCGSLLWPSWGRPATFAPRARHVGAGKRREGRCRPRFARGFLHVPSPVRSTGFPWPLPMMRIEGGLEGEKVQLVSSTMARGHAVRGLREMAVQCLTGSPFFSGGRGIGWPVGGRFGARRVVNGQTSTSG